MKAEFQIHKKRAAAFFDVLRTEEDSTLLLTFDCQKNLALPKIPDGAVYYSRQFYFQNFTVVRGYSHDNLGPDNCTSFCWTENQYKRDSNLIASCVYYSLQNIDWRPYKRVILACDGCGGQNKNTTMLGMVACWLCKDAPKWIEEVEILFPVTGHSFIPPDRVFGQIEKVVKRKETIVDPNEYISITSNFASVRSIENSVVLYDFKKAYATACKSSASLPFQISKCKRIYAKKTVQGVAVRGEYHYNCDLSSYSSLFKKGKKPRDFIICEIHEANTVSAEKKRDVSKLLENHYGTDWRSLDCLKFYSYVLDVALEEEGEVLEEEIGNDRICAPTEQDFIELLIV